MLTRISRRKENNKHKNEKALQARKITGVKLGRPQGKGKSKLDEHKADILKLVELKVPKTIIAKQYKTSVPNLYNFLKGCA